MNVRCPTCQTVFRVDPDKIPAAGIRARCARCSAAFRVEHPQHRETPPAPGAETAPPSPRPAPPSPPPGRAAPTPQVAPGLRPPAEPPVPAPTPQAAPGLRPTAEPPVPASTPTAAPGLRPTAEPRGPALAAKASAPAPVPAATAAAPVRPATAAATPPTPGPAPAPSAASAGLKRPSFRNQDPASRAQRIARALVSDIVAYNKDRLSESLAAGTLRNDFRDEIRKSWEEYVGQVGIEMAKSTPFFRDALNEILAKGQKAF